MKNLLNATPAASGFAEVKVHADARLQVINRLVSPSSGQ